LVLFLHGGPGERIGTTVVDMDAPFLGRRYEIVDPSYNGDSSAITGIVNYRYRYSLNKTLNDIWPSLHALQARYRNVTLLGGSFGGYLAAALSRELKPSDTLVLFKTIACTPYEHFITERPEGSLVAERKVTKQELVLIKKMSDGMWESYFGPFFQKSTADLIDIRRPGQIVLIYSRDDPRARPIGMELIERRIEQRARPGDAIWAMEHGSHYALRGAAEILKFERLLWPDQPPCMTPIAHPTTKVARRSAKG